MGIDLQGIARLAGLAEGGPSPANTLPVRAADFVTTVKRASDIGPFETVIQKAAEQAQAVRGPDTAPGAEAFKAKGADKARRSFEAFALQVFIGSMLPKENSKLFGTGSAGKLWQSLMAEKLAEHIAASGRLRLLPDDARTMAGAHAPVEGAKTEPSEEAG